MGKLILLAVCIASSGWFFWLYYVMVRECYAEDRRTRLRELAKRDAAGASANADSAPAAPPSTCR